MNKLKQKSSKVNKTFPNYVNFVKKAQRKRVDIMDIYPRLRDLREDKDLNQTEIAKILGTTQTQYSRWERGAQEIPFHCAIKLAKFYKVSLDYIAGLTNKKEKDYT